EVPQGQPDRKNQVELRPPIDQQPKFFLDCQKVLFRPYVVRFPVKVYRIGKFYGKTTGAVNIIVVGTIKGGSPPDQGGRRRMGQDAPIEAFLAHFFKIVRSEERRVGSVGVYPR